MCTHSMYSVGGSADSGAIARNWQHPQQQAQASCAEGCTTPTKVLDAETLRTGVGGENVKIAPRERAVYIR